MLKGIIKRTC